MEIKIPQPDEVSRKDRENGFGAYIMMFAGIYFPLPFVEIVSSFIYYIYFKKRSRYAAFHAYQSMLGQIPVTIVNTGFFVYLIVLLVRLFRDEMMMEAERNSFFAFLILVAVINVAYIIVSLYIALNAKKGCITYMPLAGRMAYDKFYGNDAVEITGAPDRKEYKNTPPE